MNVLITYSSETGNTQKLASVIYDTIAEKKEISEIKNLINVDKYDLLCIGFPIHNFGPEASAEKFLQGLPANKKIILFITHAMPANVPSIQMQIKKCLGLVSEHEVLGFFNCRGELSESMAGMMANSSNEQLREFAKMRESTVGFPNQDDLNELKEFIIGVFKSLKLK